jgi:hypothetical protein
MPDQQGSFKDEIGNLAKHNWKLILALGLGVLLGGVLANKGIKGLFYGDGKVGFTQEEPLPKGLKINGEWVYETNSQEETLGVSENQCSSVIGTADIVQVSDSSIIDIQGWRKICVDQRGKSIPEKKSWKSEIAVIVPKGSKLFFWLRTTDKPARYGFVDALISQGSQSDFASGEGSPVIKGTMYFLNGYDNTWVVAQIYLYRSGSPEAIRIKQKYTF